MSNQLFKIVDVKIPFRGKLLYGAVYVEDGRIKRVGRESSLPLGVRRIDGEGNLLLPGLIDAHVHLRGMRLSYKEDFLTGTLAAAKGGVTTVLDMPNSDPPTTSVLRLRERIDAARRKVLVNVGFHAALVSDPKQIRQLSNNGVFSFKLYMPRPIAPIPIDDDLQLASLLRSVAKNHVPLTVHAEDPSALDGHARHRRRWNTLKEFYDSHPNEAEILAVKRMMALAPTGAHFHFCHVSLPTSIRLIHGRRRFGNVSSEVTPHHLFLGRETTRNSGGISLMVPPLRTVADARKLRTLLAQGEIDIVASDHAPHSIEEKNQKDFSRVPPGIPGLETLLPLLMTEVAEGRLSISRLVKVASENPARTFGLDRKGRIDKDMDADLTIVDPKKEVFIDPERFASKAKYSPFEDTRCKGAAISTFVGGEQVIDDGEITSNPGAGQILARR